MSSSNSSCGPELVKLFSWNELFGFKTEISAEAPKKGNDEDEDDEWGDEDDGLEDEDLDEDDEDFDDENEL